MSVNVRLLHGAEFHQPSGDWVEYGIRGVFTVGEEIGRQTEDYAELREFQFAVIQCLAVESQSDLSRSGDTVSYTVLRDLLFLPLVVDRKSPFGSDIDPDIDRCSGIVVRSAEPLEIRESEQNLRHVFFRHESICMLSLIHI